MPNTNNWFANPLQAQSAARAGVPATSVSRQSQTNRPALARNVAAGQQASAGPAGMATAGYGAAGQGISPTSSRFGSQSSLGQLNDMSAGPNDPLWGDQFDMSQNAGMDDGGGMIWDPPIRPKPIGGPRPQPFPQPTQPTTPAAPAPWLKDLRVPNRSGDQHTYPGTLPGRSQPSTPGAGSGTAWDEGMGGGSPHAYGAPTGGITREQSASSPFEGWNALGGQENVSSLEGHRASQEARATGQTPFNQRGPGASTRGGFLDRGPGKSVGVMGSPGAQGQPGPGGGYSGRNLPYDIGGAGGELPGPFGGLTNKYRLSQPIPGHFGGPRPHVSQQELERQDGIRPRQAGAAGPGGGYNPQSDIGGFFGSPQPPPMSGQPGPGGGYDPQSDVGGFFGRPQPPQMPVPIGPVPSPAGYGPGYDMSEMIQFDPMHPGMYTPPGTGSSQAIPANPPPIRPIPPGGLPGQRPVPPPQMPGPGVQGRPPLITPAKPVVPHGFDPASGLGPEIGYGPLPTGAPQSWGPEEDALRAGQGGFFPYEFPPGPAGSNLGDMSSAAHRVPVSSPVPPSTPAQYIGGAPRRRGTMAGNWRGMI